MRLKSPGNCDEGFIKVYFSKLDFIHQESALYFFQKREVCQQIVMVDQTTLDIFFSLQRCYCILRVVTSNSFTKCKQGRSQYADSNLLSMVFVELHFSFYEKINVKWGHNNNVVFKFCSEIMFTAPWRFKWGAKNILRIIIFIL